MTVQYRIFYIDYVQYVPRHSIIPNVTIPSSQPQNTPLFSLASLPQTLSSSTPIPTLLLFFSLLPLSRFFTFNSSNCLLSDSLSFFFFPSPLQSSNLLSSCLSSGAGFSLDHPSCLPSCTPTTTNSNTTTTSNNTTSMPPKCTPTTTMAVLVVAPKWPSRMPSVNSVE